MVLLPPRRVAWATSEEYQMVYGCLFASDGDQAAQRYGIDRIKVWMARGSCPHAVESTASLLELLMRDTEVVGSSFRPSQQELRLSYSMALIRFVNSLVDPLQTTYFARSMASLAAQLGLPLWFVELRHAATHEDLPGISVLRDAARQALDWLYAHYWLPSLSTSSSVPLLPLDSLRPHLTTYKSLAKISLRDASKTNKLKPELLKCYRGIEGWMLEAESLGRGRERALEGLVEAFLEVGGMVPTAKKKRASARAPELPIELKSIWTPIIFRMDDAYEGFVDVLVGRMVELLSVNNDPELGAGPTGVVDRSYALTLSAWVVHFLQASEDPQMTETVVKACLLASSTNTLALLDSLTKANDQLAATVKPLINVLRNADSGLSASITDDDATDKLAEMEQRMLELEARMQGPSAKASRKQATAAPSQPLKTGWKLAENWKPCPIGALPGGKVGNLDLPRLQV
ncbi:Las1-like-domain-containing protein [Leucosporidium creatinivorum]|uniref:Las1-like-domain-containing protein n=1 Tax=Leucosporidium creatinivorum TaxID=106004 RepID=A0A1Y2D0R3_9BASI|nr:Las1-like-domain-containing protein [Leucosporidium creatinivorum]